MTITQLDMERVMENSIFDKHIIDMEYYAKIAF